MRKNKLASYYNAPQSSVVNYEFPIEVTHPRNESLCGAFPDKESALSFVNEMLDKGDLDASDIVDYAIIQEHDITNIGLKVTTRVEFDE